MAKNFLLLELALKASLGYLIKNSRIGSVRPQSTSFLRQYLIRFNREKINGWMRLLNH